MADAPFLIDFRRSCEPRRAERGVDYHPRITMPGVKLDGRRGLSFPLTRGAVAFESRDIIDDAAGSLEMVFELGEPPSDAALVHLGGQYQPWVTLSGDELRLCIYQHEARLLVRWQTGVVYRLRLHWDHTAGVTLTVQPTRGPQQSLIRPWRWQAFNQKYVIFSIGGALVGRPAFTRWSGNFRGHVRTVAVWRQAQRAPGPTLSSKEHRSVPRHRDVTLLGQDDPPIADSPHRTRSIPDRLADLKKTRRVWDLDRVLVGCSDEMQSFAALTHLVAHAWPHYEYWPWPRRQQRHMFTQRGHEMLAAIRAGDMGGMCGGYAHVMEELFWSLGHDSRRTQVHGHSTFEAWSNTFNRWVICDASHGDESHYLVDAADTPLGVSDLIRRHEALATNADALADVQGMICLEDGRTRPMDPSRTSHYLRPYTHVGIGVGDPCAGADRRSHLWYFSPHERSYFRTDMGVGGTCRLVDGLDGLYWSCNRVKVKLAWARPGRALRVSARAHAVTFPAGLEKRVDDGDWRRTAAGFTWPLHAGVNTLALRTRNQLGVAGRPWRLRLWRSS